METETISIITTLKSKYFMLNNKKVNPKFSRQDFLLPSKISLLIYIKVMANIS